MTLRTAFRRDAPTGPLPVNDAAGRRVPGEEIARRVNPSTGALEFRAPLTWTGVRRYRHADGSVTRELRRPEQVRSESHMRGLRLLTATADHPTLADGTPVYLDARGGPGVSAPDGSALRPARDFEVGHVGDAVEDAEVDGYYVPVARVAITDLTTQRKIAAGRTQTSLGYTALLDDTGGVWDGPRGPEEYDVEHVLDHVDPRVLQAVADGVLATVECVVDGEVKRVPVLGPNHYASAIWAGRGELQSEIVDFASLPPVLDGAPRRADTGTYVRVVADTAPAVLDERVQQAARSARVDSVRVGRVASDLADMLAVAPLSGRYDAIGVSEWLGWIEPAPDAVGAGGIGFVATDRLGLWWSTRTADGGVVGDGAAFAWRGIVPTESTLNPIAIRPRPFSMVRQCDESGVSGTGHVLDGVVWPAGQVTVCWCGGPLEPDDQVPCSYLTWDGFCRIHIDQHPGNGTLLAFDDGGPAPSMSVECDPTSAPTTWSFAELDDAGVAEIALLEDPFPNEHAARQVDPAQFVKFRRETLPNGVGLILGMRKGEKGWNVESVRFPRAKFTAAEARRWLKSHGYSLARFEAASLHDTPESVRVNDAAKSVNESQVASDVSFVARSESTPYAHSVRGDTADARNLTMRKIHIPARFADAANAVAATVKAPAPAKVADGAAFEVELPDGMDPVACAAALQIVAQAMAGASASMAELEAKDQEMGADYATAMQQVADLQGKVDALVADAEVGRSHRLAEVKAVAKKAGLTDAVLEGKDADAVRAAAVAHTYPTVKHLDSKTVLDGMWTAVCAKVDAIPPVIVTPAAPAVVEPVLRPAPKPHADGAGDVDRPAPRRERSSSPALHEFG